MDSKRKKGNLKLTIKNYTILSKEINKEDMIVYSSWNLAPIITNNNQDRYQLNCIQLSHFSNNNNKVIVKWKKKLL